MAAFKKKICMIGSFSVGKTSLIRQFVSGVFSEEYLTTVGVKIDQKKIEVDGEEGLLIIWDLAGRDEFARVQQSYLKGASGFFFVADGTRKQSLVDVIEEMDTIGPLFPDVPSVFLMNKNDLANEWEVTESDIESLQARLPVMKTSAMTGEAVEEAFVELSRRMI